MQIVECLLLNADNKPLWVQNDVETIQLKLLKDEITFRQFWRITK